MDGFNGELIRGGKTSENSKGFAFDLVTSALIYLFIISTLVFNHTIIYQLSLVLICAWSLIICLMRRSFGWSLFFSYYLIFVMFLIVQIYSIGTFDFITSRELLETVAINGLAYFFVFNILISYHEKIDIFRIYVVCAVITSVVFIGLSATTGSLFSARLGEDLVLNVFGQRLSFNSNSISNGCCFAASIIIFKPKTFKKWECALFVFVLILTILLSGSRKTLLIMLVAILFRLLYGASLKNAIIKFGAAIMVFALFYVIVMKVPAFYNIIGNRIETMIDFFESGSGDSSINTRDVYIDIGWSIFKENPYFGVGLGNFKNYAGTQLYSHNDYIELLSGIGIVGTVLCYLPKIHIFLETIKEQPRNKQLYLCIIIEHFALAYATVSYYKREDWILLIFILAYLEARRKKCLTF